MARSSTTPAMRGQSGTLKLAQAEVVAAELVRALRGRRSCAELSRRLGYGSNIVRRWEAGECFPTASDFLRAYAALAPNVRRCFADFFKHVPSWLDARDPFTPSQLAAFLREVRGKTPISVLAARTGLNRHSIGRWLKGSAHPRLHELLCLVEASSLRLLDFLATLTDPARMPTVADEWRKLQLAREVAYVAPWSHAVLHGLELDAYRDAPTREAGTVLARQLGLPLVLVQQSLRALAESGQIRERRGKWQVDRVVAVDTGADPERARALKRAWTEVAAERLGRGIPGNYGYSVFAISRRDLRRLKELQLQYVRAMQSLIAESTPAECVALYCSQLLDLGAEVTAPIARAPAGTSRVERRR